MIRPLAALLALTLLVPAARADDDSPGKKLFGSILKSAANKAAGREILTDDRAEGVVKTASAFRKSAEQITEKEEYFIGRAVAAKLLAKYERLEDETVNRYVQAVLQSVAANSDRPDIAKGWHAQVLKSDEVNAVSAPGGFVFVTTSLLKQIHDEDELACVLGHEVAHVSLRHGLKAIKASRLTKAFQLLGTEVAKSQAPEHLAQLTQTFDGAVDDVVKDLVVNGYSRDKEYEADAIGAEYAKRSNYDPKALTRFLESLPEAKGGLFKTHPASKKRLKELDKKDLEPSASFQAADVRKKRFEQAAAKL